MFSCAGTGSGQQQFLINRNRFSVVTSVASCTTLAPWTRRQSGEPLSSPYAGRSGAIMVIPKSKAKK